MPPVPFVAALFSAFTLTALAMIAWIQRREFAQLPASAWRRAWRNGAAGWFAGLILLGAPTIVAKKASNDAADAFPLVASMAMMMLAAIVFNITLFRSAGRLTRRQAWEFGAGILAFVLLADGIASVLMFS